ncbi:MAG: AraC family transcriptional regulator [Planctomycetota bacterium]|jgi:AraC family L-rhamnose operon regulatory protein RhaS
MIETPVFKSKDVIYKPDTCKPLVGAAQAGKIRFNALARGNYPGIKLGSKLPGIRSLGYWDASYQQDWKLDWHRNEGIEICYLETGKIIFGIEDKKYALQSGDLTLTRPWQSHYLGEPVIQACRLHWIIMDVEVRRPNQLWKWPKWIILTPKDIKELTSFLKNSPTYVWRTSAEIRHCFQKISQAIDLNATENKISRLAISINELFESILEMIRQQPVKLKPIMPDSLYAVELFIKDLIQYREYLIHPWTVLSMAKECGLGISQFRKYFKQITNMTPMNYLNFQRVNLAKKLLLEHTGKNITEIAFLCGFKTSQYFATVFREYSNYNPTEFRKSNVR